MLFHRRSGISIYFWEGCFVYACIVLPWYLFIYLEQGPAYIYAFFLKENLGRFTTEAFGPSRSIFYYFAIFITDFFPWSLLALTSFCLLWRARKEEPAIKSLSFGLPLLWCMLIFCFFSLSKNKQEYYIAPLYPAAAIIISGVLDKSIVRRNAEEPIQERDPELPMPETAQSNLDFRKRSWWIWPYSLIAIILMAGALLVPFFIISFMSEPPFLLLYGPSFLFVAGGILLVVNIKRRKTDHCFPAVAVPLWALFLIGALFFIPAFESVRPIKGFCKIIETHWSEGDEFGYFHAAAPSMVYYLRRPIFEEGVYKRMTLRFTSDKRVFCILYERDYNYFIKKGLNLHILDRHSPFALRLKVLRDSRRSSINDILLVCNHLPAQPGSREGRPRL